MEFPVHSSISRSNFVSQDQFVLLTDEGDIYTITVEPYGLEGVTKGMGQRHRCPGDQHV